MNEDKFSNVLECIRNVGTTVTIIIDALGKFLVYYDE